MEKWKNLWNGMTWLEKAMIITRDAACLFLIVFGCMEALGFISYGRIIAAAMLPVLALAQAALSWKRNKGTAIFFLGFLIFFVFVFLVSKG